MCFPDGGKGRKEGRGHGGDPLLGGDLLVVFHPRYEREGKREIGRGREDRGNVSGALTKGRGLDEGNIQPPFTHSRQTNGGMRATDPRVCRS